MENFVEKIVDDVNEKLEVQTTFNEDGLDLLVEDGEIENVEEIEEVTE